MMRTPHLGVWFEPHTHTHTNRPPFLEVSFTLSTCYMVTCLAVEQRLFPSFSLCLVFSVPKIKDINLIVCATNSSSQTSTFASVAFLSDCFQTGLIDRPDCASVCLCISLDPTSPPIVLITPARQTSSGGPLAGSITGRVRVFIRCIHPSIPLFLHLFSLGSAKVN